jgi:type IV pilus assembly protein PilC
MKTLGKNFGNDDPQNLPGEKPARILVRQRIRPPDLAIFTRQVATLLKAGMPLVRGLETLARQERNRRFREVIVELAASLRSGRAFSDALARHPRLFSRLFVNMVRAGEAGGALEAVLDRLARFQEKSLKLRAKVGAALVYPLCVMGIAGGILVALLGFVVPRFRQIFADLLHGAPLPTLTRAVVAASDLVRNHLILAAGAAVTASAAARWLRRTERGARLWDRLVLRIPLAGDLLLKSMVAQMARTLGTLLASGVPILTALAITRDTCVNRRVAEAIGHVHERVREGESVAAPLERTGVFPALVPGLVDVGEHTGELPQMLGRVADIYEDEVDNAVAGLSALLEPALIVALAGVVGTIVVALFLPIIRVVQLLS